MRIHSDFIEEADVRKAARLAGVSFTRFSLHGSRQRAQAFDVILTGSSPRRQNQGEDYAATWDEWGVFLGVLFGLDSQMVTPYYADAADFHWQTNSRFVAADQTFTPGHCHKWEFSGESVTGSYWVHECGGRNGCGAIRRHGDFRQVSA